MGEANQHSFYVSTDRHKEWNGVKRWLRIVVYDDLDPMYDDAARYSKVLRSWFKGSHGIYQPPWRRIVVEPGEEDKVIYAKNYGGLMRLYAPKLSQEVVNHESVHAAANIWRMDVDSEVRLGDDCGWREEGFAYLVGDLSATITRTLVDGGVDVYKWNQ